MGLLGQVRDADRDGAAVAADTRPSPVWIRRNSIGAAPSHERFPDELLTAAIGIAIAAGRRSVAGAHRRTFIPRSPARRFDRSPAFRVGPTPRVTGARTSLPRPLLPGLGWCSGFDESGQGLRQWALVQDAEALGGAGEGDVQFGRAPWAVDEDLFRFHDQDGVELQALRLRRHHRARHSRWPDHDAGAVAAGFVPHELVDGSGQFVLGDSSRPWLDAACADRLRWLDPGANSASSAAATAMISAGVR